MKKIKLYSILAISILFLSQSVSPSLAGPWTIEIPVALGKEAFAVLDGTLYPLGKVLSYPVKSRYPAYTASAWGKPGFTCASAVNAHHILLSVEKGKGRTISVVPSQTVAPAATPGTAFVLEGKGGTGLFGAFAPPVGSQVYFRDKTGKTSQIGPGFMPKEGETLIISADPKNQHYMADIENRPGGRIILYSYSGPKVLGRVVRPLGGTGRFEGTLYQSEGRLRANHPGVIDISTSPYGKVGGFQIVPLRHGSSPEMASMWDMTQWMIVTSDKGPDMAGQDPLFWGNLAPGPIQEDDQKALSNLTVLNRYARKSLVLVRLKGGPWRKIPQVLGRSDLGLRDVTHIRIYFPKTDA